MGNQVRVPASSSKLPNIAYSPLISRAEGELLKSVLEALPRITFPINCAAEFHRALRSNGPVLAIGGREVYLSKALGQLPAYYYPIVSLENLAEKIIELVRSRQSGAAPKAKSLKSAVEELRSQLPAIKFPIKTKAQLFQSLDAGKPYYLNGKNIDLRRFENLVDDSLMPIETASELIELGRSAVSKAKSKRAKSHGMRDLTNSTQAGGADAAQAKAPPLQD